MDFLQYIQTQSYKLDSFRSLSHLSWSSTTCPVNSEGMQSLVNPYLESSSTTSSSLPVKTLIRFLKRYNENDIRLASQVSVSTD